MDEIREEGIEVAKDYFSKEYRTWIDWVDKRLAADWSWDRIAMCGKETEEELLAYLANQDPFDYHVFSLEEWREFIAVKKEHEENSKPIEEMTFSAEVGEDDLDAPKDKNSAWIRYRNKLEGNFPGASINQIEKSSKKVLNMLYDGSGDEYKIIHGLVMGNVQSGKTANMEGLMSMAADYGWNMFIILSGTIENLRQQTRTRFMRDLQNGNLSWDYYIENPTTRRNPPEALDLGNDSRKRYVTVCLKNSVRLKKLLTWLNHDRNKKAQMKVLVIDDESDQASINTAKIEDEETTRINRLIKAIVNGNISENSEKICPYKAMNYIAYTATPYGNFLNEREEGSLYPADFIHVLPTSDTYFGPTQIFGDIVNGTTDGMPIINAISSDTEVLDNEEKKSDTSIIEALNDSWKSGDGSSQDIPESLKEAIAWFCICVAIQRYRKSRKPVSMLVHHDMKVEYHTSIARAIRHWFDNISNEKFVELCRRVYAEQTAKMSLEDFKMAYRNYGRMSGISIDDDIKDYPSFDSLYSFIAELKEKLIHHITMDKNEELNFDKGIHLCVDNCRYTPIVKDEDEDKIPHVRLVYPKDTDELDFAPAFLVVGGNTLARGLTLEGLVCTYFSRVVSQADTLMQMGRWFGYRRGYELLPRLWMTESAVSKFEQLAALDEQLRNDITERYFDDTLTPAQYGPMVSTCPMLVKMKITAGNKMQGAVAAEANFAGAHIQTIRFENNDKVLQNNLDVADAFITSLGEDNHSLNADHEAEYKVWEDVPFEQIKKGLFMKSHYELTNMEGFDLFCEWYESKNYDFDNWTVILSGKKSTDRQWHGVGKIMRSRRLSGIRKADSYKFSIGILSDPGVWDRDLNRDYVKDLNDEERSLLQTPQKSKAEETRQLKSRIRKEQGKENVPRLVLYCIDKDSTTESTENRAPLNTNVDVMGVEIIVPGQRAANENYTSAVQIK